MGLDAFSEDFYLGDVGPIESRGKGGGLGSRHRGPAGSRGAGASPAGGLMQVDLDQAPIDRWKQAMLAQVGRHGWDCTFTPALDLSTPLPESRTLVLRGGMHAGCARG